MLQGSAPAPAPAGLDVLVRTERREVAEIGVGEQHDVAAGPAVSAVRSTLGHVLLATEREAAVAAPPRLHVDAGTVVEHDRR